MYTLSINSGSTSFKCSLYFLPPAESNDNLIPPLWQAEISWRGAAKGELKVQLASGTTKHLALQEESREQAIRYIISRLWTEAGILNQASDIECIGHRVVHGGQKYYESTKIDEGVLEDLRGYEELAPNHQHENLRGISVAQAMMPNAMHVAVFDTAFHHGLPIETAMYALPYEWYQRRGIRRYGFHGISHNYCAKRAMTVLGDFRPDFKIITCHLGGGSSLSAVDGGKCVDTTMGFTPMEGIVMQTRSGSIDPGLIHYLLQQGQYSIEALNTVLTQESGLKGISGMSGDMKEIEHAMKNGNERAKLAFDAFCYSVAKYVGSLVPSLGRLDALSFAGGIGENSHAVRQSVCAKLSYLGIELNEMANVSGESDRVISSESASTRVLVIHTREELAIARSAHAVQLKLELGEKVR